MYCAYAGCQCACPAALQKGMHSFSVTSWWRCAILNAGPRLFTAFRTSTRLLPDLESRSPLQSRILRHLSMALEGDQPRLGLVFSLWRLNRSALVVSARHTEISLLGEDVPSYNLSKVLPGHTSFALWVQASLSRHLILQHYFHAVP